MYMDYILTNGKPPANVYMFSKENNFDESLFYQSFGSFAAVEKSIFAAFFDNTLALLEKNTEFNEFDNRNKLLSFYFTFFENLTANRSFILSVLEQARLDYDSQVAQLAERIAEELSTSVNLESP